MQNTAYVLRISDWSSDVCSSDRRVSEVIVADITRHWIGGRWETGGAVENSLSPSTGEVLGQFVSGGAAEADAAVAAARAAFDIGTWSHDRDRKSTRLNSSH